MSCPGDIQSGSPISRFGIHVMHKCLTTSNHATKALIGAMDEIYLADMTNFYSKTRKNPDSTYQLLIKPKSNILPD